MTTELHPRADRTLVVSGECRRVGLGTPTRPAAGATEPVRDTSMDQP